MKKIFVFSLFFIVLLSISVFAINSKTLRINQLYYSNIAEAQNIGYCDISASIISPIRTLQYNNKNYLVIGTKNQIYIINNQNNKCSIIDSINTGNNLTSYLETYKNYLIFHTNDNHIWLYNYDGKFNLINDYKIPFGKIIYNSMIDDSDTDGIAENSVAISGETSSFGLFNRSILIQNLVGKSNAMALYYNSKLGNPENRNFIADITLCKTSLSELTNNYNDCSNSEIVLKTNFNISKAFNGAINGEKIIILFDINYTFISGTNYIIKFKLQNNNFSGVNNIYQIKTDKDSGFKKVKYNTELVGTTATAGIIKSEFIKINLLNLINNSLSNNEFSCGNVLNNQEKCFILDNYDGLYIININNSLSERIQLENDSTKFSVSGHRIPLIANLDDINRETGKQLVYRIDHDNNNLEGLKAINLNDYSVNSWGEKDNLVSLSTIYNNCGYLTNPKQYIFNYGLAPIYYGKTIKDNLNSYSCKTQLIKADNVNSEIVVEVKHNMNFQTTKNQWFSRISEPFILRNEGFPEVCIEVNNCQGTSCISSPSNVRGALLCYDNLNSTSYLSSEYTNYYTYRNNQYIYPSIVQLTNLSMQGNTILSGEFNAYFDYGEQKIIEIGRAHV